MDLTHSHLTASLADAEPAPYWLGNPNRPEPRAPLTEDTTTDLAIVGGGYSGLWTAILAKERNPERDVVLLEANRVGWAASGRNGGFCEASLTHGRDNGATRFPGEIDVLDELGLANLDQIEEAIAHYRIDCDFHRPGTISVATEAHQVDLLKSGFGEFLDRDTTRDQVNSPTYLASSWERRTSALVDPARLAWGLADAAQSLGVRIAEGTRVSGLARVGAGMRVRTTTGATITAGHVALGTNAFPSLVRRVRLHTVPVYDYVLVTEPLSPQQLDSVGWRNRQGISDVGNQFHYYRLTADNRILWGGYDAIYHYGRKIQAAYDQRPDTFRILAAHFFRTFPQLEGLRFTHRWGGAIDTCTRFFAFFGTAHQGRVAYALGYTGLGVGATRFGAEVMLDLLSGKPTERTALEMVRTKPIPFPPEPLTYLGIQATRRALAAADRNQGRRNLWLRALDRLGLGFDS